MPLVYIIGAAFISILLLALLARIVRESRFAIILVNIAAGVAFVVMVSGLYATQFGGTL